jgi:hypothetical protein
MIADLNGKPYTSGAEETIIISGGAETSSDAVSVQL